MTDVQSVVASDGKCHIRINVGQFRTMVWPAPGNSQFVKRVLAFCIESGLLPSVSCGCLLEAKCASDCRPERGSRGG